MFARTVGITENHMDIPPPVTPKLPQNNVSESKPEKERIIAKLQQETWKIYENGFH